MILNLKSLNQYVVYHHFKMDTIWTAVAMMKPGCYMATIDLKDAYYSVSIAKLDRKYLKFSWRGNLYELTCFPNGLAFCPRKFTKLLKPVYSTLRWVTYQLPTLMIHICKLIFMITVSKMLLIQLQCLTNWDL